MNASPRRDEPPSTGAFHKTFGLLRLGIVGPRRNADRLLERLEAGDGAQWLARCLAGAPFTDIGDPTEGLARGGANVEQLNALKDKGKRLMANDSNDADVALGLLAYFLSVAAGLVHHRAWLSSQPARAIGEILGEMASLTPTPWSELLGKAAYACERGGVDPATPR